MASPFIPPCESVTVEFKSQWSKDSIPKTLVAFANTQGGDLYIGVSDEGDVIGVEDADQVRQSLASVLADRVFPSLYDCVTDETLQIGHLQVVRVRVDRGRNRPYSLDSKNAGTIFIRSGNTTRPAQIAEICDIARESNLIPFESRIAAEQNLTFTTLQTFCQQADFAFDPQKNLQYGFWDADKQRYTNLAFLCSDQNTCNAVVACFSDNAKLNLISATRIEGSVLRLLSDGMKALEPTNLIRMEIPTDGSAQRKETYAVNPVILREALVNAIAHRDYTRTVATSVHVTPAQIDIFTGGGLADLSPQEILDGRATDCRNQHLALLLERLHLMEGIGNGFRLIRAEYSDKPLRDLLKVEPRSFTIILPRRQSVRLQSEDSDANRILAYLADHTNASRREIQAAVGCSQSQCILQLRLLLNQGLITASGQARSRRYSLPEHL